MVNDLVHKQFAIATPHHLVDLHHPSASFVVSYVHRLDMRIKNIPLPCPVVPHTFVSIDEPAVHPVRPDHVGGHAGEDVLQPPAIEVAIRPLEDFTLCAHPCSLFPW